MGSGSSPDDMELAIKKDMAMKLAQKMMDDGHIVFTKQQDMADNSMRYKAYTWVGNKDFIEQQRKNKR
jgi:transcription initiation factor IIE alpha subunit